MRSVEELVAGIESHHDELDETSEQAEVLGTAPDALVKILKAIREPMVKVPADLGGDDLVMADQVRYFEALSYANPTAGWVGFNNAGAAAKVGSSLCDAGAELIFGSNPAPLFAAVSVATGT